MITRELFSHVYFSMPLLSLNCTYLDSLIKYGFQGLNRASKINVGIRLGLGLCFQAKFRLQNEANLSQVCSQHPKLV